MQRMHVADRTSPNIFRAKRYEIETTISFRIRGEESWRDGLTGNISVSGVLFRSDHVVKLSTPIEMKLELPPELRGADGAEVFRRGVIVRSSVYSTESGEMTLSYAAIVLPDSGKSTVAILGVPIDNLSMDEVMRVVEDQITEGGFHQVATANVDFLIQSIHDDELHEILCRCDLVLPDGMPLIWASRLMGSGLKERVTGADLVPRLAQLSAQRGYRVFLLGAEEESSARAAAWMETQYPGVCIAGRYSPEFKPLEQMDHQEILRRIEEARPDILLVAFGNPKQEKWLAMHRHALNVPLCVGIGASLDFLSGKVSRAPKWMQASSLEWAYRLCQEPARLAKRYLGNAIGLLCFLTLQLVATAAQARRSSAGKLTRKTVGTSTVFRIEGGFSSSLLSSLETEVCSAIFSGTHIVFDLSNTAYLGPDALGSLVHLESIAHRWKREFWLTGLRPFLKRVIYATQLGSRFRIAPMVADALRRIEPAPLAISGWADENRVFCRIGGEMIPIHPHEVQDLYYQMQFLLKHQVMHEQILKPITVRNSMVANGTVQSDGMGEMLNSFTVIERVS
jgi:N-acetylglucosaminyldiphosphoundecaprenol N-acetyl-beta-D-mannosaminyltransferase